MPGEIIYNLFITPIEMIFEVIFYILQLYPALAIVAISLVMNFLALPLYLKADAINEEQRLKTASMADRVGKIKKTFKGDERYMMLSTYYREQHYKPVYALKSTFSLLLQIPFFIAAYHFLSNCSTLNGASFLFLKDLGQPDALLDFGSFSINLMPVVMTVINVISAYIYLRGSTLREKIQTYGIALIFLVLLYKSPSGLVLYWTLNQLFSVCKNIVLKLVKKYKKPVEKVRRSRKQLKTSLFLYGAVYLSVLLGIVIPMSVISSSPTEFSTAFSTPAGLVINTFSISAGFFIIWFGVYYYMSNTLVRNIFTYAVFVMSGVSTLNFMVFSKELGTLSSYLIYDTQPSITPGEMVVNIICDLALAAALILLLMFLQRIVRYIYIIIILGCCALAAVNIYTTASELSEARKRETSIQDTDQGERNIYTPEDSILTLSTKGKNVMIFMLDRGISGYVPYIMNEKPEIREQFEGFTYYPNTLSFGCHTSLGAPAIFGGYEYTPVNMNARDDVLLKDKHDDALLMMPTLFNEAGYKISICDPPYAGFNYYPPDYSIYNDLENVTTHHTFSTYAPELMEIFSPPEPAVQKWNFFMYSIMKTVPAALHNIVYEEGSYCSITARRSLSCQEDFLNSYSVLYMLPELTEVVDDDINTVFFIDNETPHYRSILQTPEYEPTVEYEGYLYADMGRFTLDGVSMSNMMNQKSMGFYHVNMASFIKLGEWFDYLREKGVYDNTRIIIVSDHGYNLANFDELIISEDNDAEFLNSLLLVKDFGDKGELRTSNEFMTTGDVPTITMEGLIDDPVNPFTGNPVNSDVNKEEQPATVDHNAWNVQKFQDKTTYDLAPDSFWIVHGDVHDKTKWERVQ